MVGKKPKKLWSFEFKEYYRANWVQIFENWGVIITTKYRKVNYVVAQQDNTNLHVCLFTNPQRRHYIFSRFNSQGASLCPSE